MATLGTYETQVSDLLHDPSSVIWSLAQIDRYINEARRQLVMDAGCLRSLQTVYFTQNVESYAFGSVTGASITAGGTGYVTPTVSFAGGGGSGVAATLTVTSGAVTSISFTNLGSGYTSAPTATINPIGGGTGAAISVGVINVNTYDVLGIGVIWGSTRYQLAWRAWSVFSARLRGWVGQQNRPEMWAAYGENAIYIGQLPDQTYQAELDSVILPADLAAIGDVDSIPTKYQDCVQFFAAYKAKFNMQQFGEAEVFLRQYRQTLLERGAAYVRRLPDPYAAGAPA